MKPKTVYYFIKELPARSPSVRGSYVDLTCARLCIKVGPRGNRAAASIRRWADYTVVRCMGAGFDYAEIFKLKQTPGWAQECDDSKGEDRVTYLREEVEKGGIPFLRGGGRGGGGGGVDSDPFVLEELPCNVCGSPTRDSWMLDTDTLIHCTLCFCS